MCGDPNVPAGRCSFSGFGDLLPAARADELAPASCRCMFLCQCLQVRAPPLRATPLPPFYWRSSSSTSYRLALSPNRLCRHSLRRLRLHPTRTPSSPPAAWQPHEVASGEVVVLGAMAAAARTAAHGYRGPQDHPAKLVFYRPRTVAPLPPELRAVGAAAPEGSAHVLLIWDGDEFRSSSRLAPIVLRGPTADARSSDAEAAAAVPFDVTHGLAVQHGEEEEEENGLG